MKINSINAANSAATYQNNSNKPAFKSVNVEHIRYYLENLDSHQMSRLSKNIKSLTRLLDRYFHDMDIFENRDGQIVAEGFYRNSNPEKKPVFHFGKAFNDFQDFSANLGEYTRGLRDFLKIERKRNIQGRINMQYERTNLRKD